MGATSSALLCNPPTTLLTGLYLKKMVSEIAGRRSTLSVFLSDTSCCCTVYDAGWEALRGGGGEILEPVEV